LPQLVRHIAAEQLARLGQAARGRAGALLS